MKTEIFTAADGKAISLKIWDEASEPRMVLQLVHGMAEHVSRYNDFAEYLNSCGIIVAGDDHRAHGDTDPDALGLAGEGDLFHKTVEDEKGITALLKERYGLPVVIMGHSYGSFLTQRYISLGTSDIAGCILMGSAAMEGFVVNVGARIAAKKMKKGEKDARGKFFAKQTFVKYDKKIKDGINGWLCRDRAEVGKFNTDPQCNFTCSNGFYHWFFGGMKAIAADKGKNTRKALPLMIISGTADGVGGYGKLVKKLYNRYVKFGLTPDLRLIDGARHELVNETNKQEIYETVRDFVLSIH